MGLWIVRGLLAVENGRVWAENLLRAGRSSRSLCRQRRSTPIRRVRLIHMTTQYTRILLVDDEAAIQRAVGPCCVLVDTRLTLPELAQKLLRSLPGRCLR